jgi:outer membrane lipoprotein SlyB
MPPIDLLAEYPDTSQPVDLLSEYPEEEKQAWYSRYPRDLAAGLLEGARGIGNVPHLLHLPNAPYFEPTDFNKMVGLKGEPTLSDKLVNALGQFGPTLALPEASLGRLGPVIESIPKVGKFLKESIGQAIPQIAYGIPQNENPLKGAEEAGIGSLVGSGLGAVIGKGINALRPTKMYQSPLSKRELAQSYRQAEGTNADLGNIIQNPMLQRLYENKLPKVTGEASAMMSKTGSQIVNKGESILTNLLGSHSPENVPEQITQKLTDSYYQHQKFKNEIYNAVNELADAHNLKLELPNFANEAKKYMSAIEDTNILKHEPDARQILSKLIHYQNPVKETTTTGLLVDKSGKPLLNETKIEFPTLKEANILKGKLGQYAKTFSNSPDPSQRNMANIFRNLANKLKQDIGQSIDKSGNEVLKKGYKTAEENYAKNYSPFLDKDIYKFISGNADPETIISKFITNSRTSDLSGKLSKLAGKLSKPGETQGSEQSNLLAYGYLSRALDNEGNFNPSKFATLIKNLGPNQLKTLFPDKVIRKQLLDYKSLVNKNPRSLQVMFNPLTGQVNSDINPHALANIVGGLSGLLTGGTPGAVVGTVLGPVIQSKLAKFATKKLTDPAYRRKFINSLIANKDIELKKTKNILQKGGAVIPQMSDNHRPLDLELIHGQQY